MTTISVIENSSGIAFQVMYEGRVAAGQLGDGGAAVEAEGRVSVKAEMRSNA